MRRLTRKLSSLSAWVFQPVLILVFLIVGYVAASQLSLRREPPQRSETAVYAPLVRTVVASVGSHPAVVHGHGTLEARTRIDLVAQVGGEIVEIHPGLRAGGRFRAGEVLARIEPRDYELSVARSRAEVSSAETSMVMTTAESESAVQEWNQLRPGEPCPPLVSLEPQLIEAQARALAANAELERAQLDLARTRITLPFDGRVVQASVDVGEVVPANQPLGVVYATDVFEVAVPLRTGELTWLELPGPESLGSQAVVRGEGSGGPFEVTGRIARVRGELDATSRLARVVVEIPTADLSPSIERHLLPGIFVDVELIGREVEEVVEIPRGALREGGTVWVERDGAIAFAHPTVVRSSNGIVFVEGLAPGTRVVTSNLEVVTEGMRVRPAEGSAGQ